MDGVIELNEVKLENIKLKSEIQVAYGHVRSQEVIAQGLSNQNVQLQSMMTAQREAHDEEVDGYKKQNLHLQLDIEVIQTELSDEKKSSDDLKEKLRSLGSDFETLRAKLTNDVNEVRRSNRETLEENCSLKDRVALYESANRTLIAENDKLFADHKDSITKKKNLEESIAKLQSEVFFLSSRLLQVEKSNSRNLMELQKIDDTMFFISSQLTQEQTDNNSLVKTLHFMDQNMSRLMETVDAKDSDVEYYHSKSNILIKQLAAAKAENIKMQIEYAIEADVSPRRERDKVTYCLEDEKETQLVGLGESKKRKRVKFIDDSLVYTIGPS